MGVKINRFPGQLERAASSPSGGSAPATASYICIGLDGTLTAERVLAVTAGQLTLADGGPNGNAVLALANAGPGATGPIGDGTTVPVVTIDAKGRVTALTSATIVGPFPPSGAAGGDLTGTYPNPTIADADLIALRDLAATAGILSRTGAGAFAARSLTAPAAGLTISNPTGAAGNPTFALANDLAALEGLGSTGFAVRTAADTWAQRSISVGTGMVISNADGVAGSPSILLSLGAIDHNSLLNVAVGDVHIQYTKLTGRTGTTNDTTLSTTTDGTLYGSTATPGSLKLYATSAGAVSRYHATSSTAANYDNYVKLPNAGIQVLQASPITLKGIVPAILLGDNSQIFHMQKDTIGVSPYDDPEILGFTTDDNQQVIFEADSRATEAVTWTGFAWRILNDTGTTRKISTITGLVNGGICEVNGGTVTITGAGNLGVLYSPTFKQTAGAGTATFDAATDAVAAAVLCNGSISTGWTLRGYYGLKFNKPSGAGGSVTVMAAVHIADISDARFTARSLVSLGATVPMLHKGIIQASTTASDTLRLQGTSSATTGSVDVLDVLRIGVTAPTYSAIGILIDAFPNGLTVAAGGALNILRVGQTYTLTGAPNVFGLANVFNYSPIIKTANGTAVTAFWPSVVFNAAGTFRADGAAFTCSNDLVFGSPAYTAVIAIPTFDVINAGTGTLAGFTGLYTQPTIGTGWTATDVFGVKIANPLGAGTITNCVGVDIAKLTRGGTINLGIRNASPTAFTPSTAQAISAAGNAILADATLVMVSNTTAGSLTLTSTPTIANGQDGQVVIILATGTQNVVVQDQGTLASSNLRLGAATRTLTPRDVLVLTYSSTVGDWVEILFNAVI